MVENRVSQNRSTCWGRSSSSAASEIVRNASGDFSNPNPFARKAYFPARTIDLLILDFNTLLGLNTRTCRGRIGTSCPVLGLRPIRWFFERTWNEPNELSLTFWPERQAQLVRLVPGPLEEPADRAQPQDRAGGADPAATGSGVQTQQRVEIQDQQIYGSCWKISLSCEGIRVGEVSRSVPHDLRSRRGTRPSPARAAILGDAVLDHQAAEARRRAALLSPRRRAAAQRHPAPALRSGFHAQRRPEDPQGSGRAACRGYRQRGRRRGFSGWRDAR